MNNMQLKVTMKQIYWNLYYIKCWVVESNEKFVLFLHKVVHDKNYQIPTSKEREAKKETQASPYLSYECLYWI